MSPLDYRQATWDRARSATVDVVVVGGGINGVGVALDAVSRGLSSVLVERDDLAVGTSSRSSKLIHGGLRYLEQYRFGLVREALAERDLLGRLAPHIVSTERFLVPVIGGRWQVPYIAAGLTIYDLLGGRQAGRFRMVDRASARHRVPSLASHDLRGAFEYSDAVFDDARLVIALARTASQLGAGILTRAEMLGSEAGHKGERRLSIGDRLTGETHELHARAVVDATGAFSAGDEEGLVPSRGIHLLVRRDVIPASTGLTIRVPGRVVFLIPWLDQWLIGTTDATHSGPIDRPRAHADEVEYLFDSLSRVLDTDLDIDDIVSTCAGIRPLADDGEMDGDTASLSREERIEEREPGVFTVRGGKYTTYRRVAMRTLDRVVTRIGRGGPSMTSTIPVVGAAPPATLSATETTLTGMGWDPAVSRRLVMRHGIEATEVAAVATTRGLDEPLVAGFPYLGVEAWWALHKEWAMGIDDVLARRTRLALEDSGHGDAAVDTTATILGDSLGWDADERAAAAVGYRESSAYEYGVPVLSRLHDEVAAG